MDKKLTLKLNQAIIDKAKEYARDRNISLSRLIENYLSTLTSPRKKDDKISPLVKSLSGVIELPEDYDVKKEYRDHINEKYQ